MLALDIPVELDRSSPTSLRGQIVEQLKAAIDAEVLGPDDPLPSSRACAAILGVSRSTVLAAYLELEGDEWVYSVHGAGTFVARRNGGQRTDARSAPIHGSASCAEPKYDLRPGILDPALICGAVWRSAWRGVTPSRSGPDPCGDPLLRASLATYLASARGLTCHADEIIVCAGASEALTLLAFALGWSGQAVAVEDPGYPAVRKVLTRLGALCVALDVTVPELLPARLSAVTPAPVAVYLTPSHQYPMGHRIEESDRRLILEWARQVGAVVVEDDYDGEFRFGVAPIPSMASMDPESNTAYIGTLSKVLDPSLRIAYLRVPPRLRDAVTAVRNDLGATVAGPVQHVVTYLIRSGELSRHIARVRRIYADRRRALLQSLSEVPTIAVIRGMEAGLHVVCEFSDDVDVPKLIVEAQDRGLSMTSLDEFRAIRGARSNAVVLHYGGHPPQLLRQAVAVLATCPSALSARGVTAPLGGPEL